MSDLKPCPFCGGDAAMRIDTSHSTAALIGCATIGCFGHEQWGETEAEAIAAWNRRATPPEVTVLVEALQDAVTAWDDHNKTGDMMQGWWAQEARRRLAAWDATQK